MDASHIFVIILVIFTAGCLVAMERNSRRNARQSSRDDQGSGKTQDQAKG